MFLYKYDGKYYVVERSLFTYIHANTFLNDHIPLLKRLEM